ncbi:MAG TPA: ribosomal protein S18-alanine N-acetyltransferase [Rhodanobacteraceae bacterium]|nr:ribosomal protein S18-alanine N-acetyltransferase [Rhodanobacteraceae bacterium]
MAAVAPLEASLRPMAHEDISAVANIEAAAYEFPWSRGIFRSCLDNGHHCWVLERGRTIIGYGVLSVGAGEAHILNVCVAPLHQGHGHGAYLLKRMLDLARWHQAGRVFLEVRPSNQLAHAMYERAGFNEIGRRPGYYPARRGREDAIVMAMELLPPEAR